VETRSEGGHQCAAVEPLKQGKELKETLIWIGINKPRP
jgi:hypothetical protein